MQVIAFLVIVVLVIRKSKTILERVDNMSKKNTTTNTSKEELKEVIDQIKELKELKDGLKDNMLEALADEDFKSTKEISDMLIEINTELKELKSKRKKLKLKSKASSTKDLIANFIKGLVTQS